MPSDASKPLQLVFPSVLAKSFRPLRR